MKTPSYQQIIAMAIPIILANSTTPLLGLADTAVVGNFASTAHLGAIAVGALIFSFIYWGFGFLRMSTTGFIAQAAGQQDNQAVISVFVRALLLATVLGLAILILQWPLIKISLWLFGASAEVESLVAEYFSVRIWGAPATLANYVILGYFIGNGLNRTLLLVQLCLNGINILLDLLFAGYLDMGAKGVALGTLLAEWSTLFLGLRIAHNHAKTHFQFSLKQLPWVKILDRQEIKHTLQANSDIMIRTLFLLLGFAIFTDQAARFGDTQLAANHILLQFISFSAFFLDGFAYVSEYYVGQAKGQRALPLFRKVVYRTSVLAAITGFLLACTMGVLGSPLIALLTQSEPVQLAANAYLMFALCYIALSSAAFQLDGIFIGATYTKALRNASVMATLVFLVLSTVLVPAFSNHGLWIAFIGFIVLRAVFLGFYFPGLQRQFKATAMSPD